jgi:hypothetical protein
MRKSLPNLPALTTASLAMPQRVQAVRMEFDGQGRWELFRARTRLPVVNRRFLPTQVTKQPKNCPPEECRRCPVATLIFSPQGRSSKQFDASTTADYDEEDRNDRSDIAICARLQGSFLKHSLPELGER